MRLKNKILILTSEFPPQPGGIGNHAFHLARELKENGYEITLICDQRSQNGELERPFDAEVPFKVIRVPRQEFILLTYIQRIKSAFALSEEVDWVIVSGKFSLWTGALLRLFRKSKFIAIIHGGEVQLSNFFLRKLTEFSLRKSNTVIAVSNFTKSLIAHLSLNDVQVIPNGFEMEEKGFRVEKENPMPVLITVGNVTQRKGQHNVIKALPILLKKYPDLKYHIVGIPTHRDKLEKLILHLGVEKSVVFHGQVDEATKQHLLLQADIFVMLSEKDKSGDVEGFGIAILEANALGIPAIGATGCGIEDAIKEGYSGLLVNPKSPEQFEKALTKIIIHYQLYSINAKNWSSNFKWEKMIKKYLNILRT